MNVLSEAEIREAAESPVVATTYLAELLVSHETLRALARELAAGWLQFRGWDCLNPIVLQDPCTHGDLPYWRDVADGAIAKARAAGLLEADGQRTRKATEAGE